MNSNNNVNMCMHKTISNTVVVMVAKAPGCRRCRALAAAARDRSELRRLARDRLQKGQGRGALRGRAGVFVCECVSVCVCVCVCLFVRESVCQGVSVSGSQ